MDSMIGPHYANCVGRFQIRKRFGRDSAKPFMEYRYPPARRAAATADGDDLYRKDAFSLLVRSGPNQNGQVPPSIKVSIQFSKIYLLRYSINLSHTHLFNYICNLPDFLLIFPVVTDSLPLITDSLP